MKSWIHVLATDPVERKLIEAQQKKRDCELNIKHFCLRTECFRNVELHRFHLLHSCCTFYTKTNPTLTRTWVWFLKSPDGENMSVYTTCCRPQVCVLSAVQVCVRCVSPKQCCTKLILWYEGIGVFCSVTATSCFILFWEEQYLVLFVAWTSAVFYWPFLLKNIIFSCFVIILADLFLKLRAVIFILLFKIYLFCNFWEDLECKRSRRHGRNVLLTVVEGVPTLLITHTHTRIYKSFDFCVLLFILTRAITVHVDKQN